MREMDAVSAYRTDSAARTTTFVDEFNKVSVIVTLNDSVDEHQTLTEIIGLLVHESVHVWQVVRDKMGEDAPSPEFEAYSVQAIFQSIYDGWEQTRGRFKKT